MVVGKIVHDPHQLGPWLSRWDALAVTSRLPYCAPAWMLAWWRHAAPPYSQLRVVTVTNEGELLGVAPFFLEQGLGRLNRYRLLGPRNSTPRDLLARPGAEKQVAAAIATTSRRVPAVWGRVSAWTPEAGGGGTEAGIC